MTSQCDETGEITEEDSDFDPKGLQSLAREASARPDALRLDGRALLPIELPRAQDIELNYTSNAIEGNALTRGETAKLIEHGLFAGGKHVKDHLEILDHYDALRWMREHAAERRPVNEDVVLELHRRTLLRSRPDIGGSYARFGRGITGSAVVLPNPLKVSILMQRFGAEQDQAP